jgi:hypothetical protein
MRRDDGACARNFDLLDKGIGVVALVGNNGSHREVGKEL